MSFSFIDFFSLRVQFLSFGFVIFGVPYSLENLVNDVISFKLFSSVINISQVPIELSIRTREWGGG